MKLYRKKRKDYSREDVFATDILGMARLWWVPPNVPKGIEVYVHTDDFGRFPHFHVRKYGSNNTFEWETCIRYGSAEYFVHGHYDGKLPNSNIAKRLDCMLRTINPKRRGITYWETAIDDWNANNSTIQLPQDLEQPDYTKLK